MSGVVYLDKDKQEIMDAIDSFRARVEKGKVSDFIILGVNSEEAEVAGFFTMLSIGDEIEKINLIVDLTKQNIVDNIMSAAAFYSGEEIADYDDEEGEDSEKEIEFEAFFGEDGED